MEKIKELLMSRQYYLNKITELQTSVMNNHKTRKQIKYYKKAVSMLEENIQKELDNESK